MKILLVHGSADWSISDVSRGYAAALKRAGHNVREAALPRYIDFFGHAVNTWNKKHELEQDDEVTAIAAIQFAAEKAFVDGVRHSAELVVVVAGMGFHPDGLWLMRNVGMNVALVCTESPYNDLQHNDLAKLVDTITVNDRNSVEAITECPNVHYLASAYDPDIHRPLEVGPEYQSDVFFVGTGFTERQELLETVDWTGIDVKIYGYWATLSSFSPLFPFVKKYTLNNEESVKWYSGAKLCLNLHRDGDGYSANPRTFELAACGVHQLVDDRRQEVRDILGDSVCYFSGPYDLEEKVRYCLAHPEHRVEKAQMAMIRVQDQTFDRRVADLLSWCTPHR